LFHSWGQLRQSGYWCVSLGRLRWVEMLFAQAPLLRRAQGGGGGPSSYLQSNFSLIATAKHAIAYGASNADGYSVDVSTRTLFDMYVRPWRDFAAAGGRGLMVSHPALNGVPMHANAAILNTTLRGMLGLSEAVFGSDNENVLVAQRLVSVRSRRGLTPPFA